VMAGVWIVTTFPVPSVNQLACGVSLLSSEKRDSAENNRIKPEETRNWRTKI
jgi:hypothetical protein